MESAFIDALIQYANSIHSIKNANASDLQKMPQKVMSKLLTFKHGKHKHDHIFLQVEEFSE